MTGTWKHPKLLPRISRARQNHVRYMYMYIVVAALSSLHCNIDVVYSYMYNAKAVKKYMYVWNEVN